MQTVGGSNENSYAGLPMQAVGFISGSARPCGRYRHFTDKETAIINNLIEPNKTSAPGSLNTSLQLRVLRFGLLQDGDVGVGVFPEREKVLICTLRFGGVPCRRVGATKLEMRQ
jgi:hypothetical protein